MGEELEGLGHVVFVEEEAVAQVEERGGERRMSPVGGWVGGWVIGLDRGERGGSNELL